MGATVRMAALWTILVAALVAIGILVLYQPPGDFAAVEDSIAPEPARETDPSVHMATPAVDVPAPAPKLESESIPEETLGARISGIIVDAHGTPLAGMCVEYTNPKSKWARTPPSGGDGRFTIEELDPGAYSLIARREHTRSTREAGKIELTVASDAHVENVLLVFHEEGAVIVGRVLDTRYAPVAGARVEARNHDIDFNTQVASDSDGAFTLHVEPNAPYELWAWHEDFAIRPKLEGQRPNGPRVDIILEAFATLEGRVVDAATGKPVTRFEIVHRRGILSAPEYLMSDYATVEDPGGHFTLDKVPPGAATILVRADGFTPENVSLPALSPAEHRDDIRIRLKAGTRIEGIVLSKEGAPVSGASIHIGGWVPILAMGLDHSIRGGEPNTHSGEDGRFVLDGLGADVTALTATHDDYAHTAADVRLIPGKTAAIKIVMAEGGTIAGHVLVDGAPVDDESVKVNIPLSRTPSIARTDENGYFRIDRLPEGERTARVTFSQSSMNLDQQKTVHITEGGVTTVNFQLETGTGALEGHVTLDGAPPAIGSVAAFRLAGEDASTTVSEGLDADGGYRIAGLPPGRYRFWARAATDAESSQRTRGMDVEIERNHVTHLDIDLPDTHIRGRIHGLPEGVISDVFALRAGSTPAAIQVGMQLTPAIRMHFEAQAQVKFDGSYDLGGLAGGDYILVAVAASHAARTSTIVAVDSGVTLGGTDVAHDVSVYWDPAP